MTRRLQLAARRVRRRAALLALTCATALLVLPTAGAARDAATDPMLAAAQSLFGGPPPSTRALLEEARIHARRPARARELTPVLAELALRLKTLTGGQRREAQRLLARPTDGAADPQQNGYTAREARNSPLCSAHFCVHWVDSGSDTPDLTDSNGNGIPDYVETVDGVAEHVYSVENGQLGWRTPKGDGQLGGGLNLTDIYLKNVGGSGIYGYTAPDPGQNGPHLYAYLVIDNSFDAGKFPHYPSALQPLEVTLAHEYNHVLQFNYDAPEDTWMFESTAVWMEGRVYPEVHDYYQYLPGWASLTRIPITSFDGTNPNDRSNVKVYGSSVWNKWLDARYGPDVVRDAWGASTSTRPPSFAPAAYNASIRAHHGRGFFDEFARFSVATAEWQAANSGFPEGPAYPDVRRAGTLAATGPAGSIRIDHAAFALINVTHTEAARIKLIVTAPRRVASAIALVGRGGGLETTVIAELSQGGKHAVVLAGAASFARVTAAIVNADSSERGYSPSGGDWKFTKNDEPYGLRITTDFTSPRVRGRSPRAGSRNVSPRTRVSVTFTKPVFGLSHRSVELLGPGRRRVPVRISFHAGSRTVTLIPAAPLRHGRRYRVLLTRAITDGDLNALAAASWTFATR